MCMLTIDDFTVLIDKHSDSSADSFRLHVVTHCHKDHLQNIPRKGVVCATQWTLDHLPASLTGNVVAAVPGNEYFGFLRVFETVHCTGSIGVWIPLIGYLHLGDGRITPELLHHILHDVVGEKANVNIMVIDGLYYHFKELIFDSVSKQVNTFRQHIQKAPVPLRIRFHAGTCFMLSLLPDLIVKLDDDDAVRASHLVPQLTNTISDVHPDVILCLRAYECAASSTFFACAKYMQQQNITADSKGITRICFSTHASHQETQALLDALKPHRVLFETAKHLRVIQRLKC
jgi:hypothetical protein